MDLYELFHYLNHTVLFGVSICLSIVTSNNPEPLCKGRLRRECEEENDPAVRWEILMAVSVTVTVLIKRQRCEDSIPKLLGSMLLSSLPSCI